MTRATMNKSVKAALLCVLLLHDSFTICRDLGDEETERARLSKVAYDLPKEINTKLGLEVSTVNMPRFSRLLWGARQIKIDSNVVQILVLYSNNIHDPPKVQSQTPEGLYESLKPILEAKSSKIGGVCLNSAEARGDLNPVTVAVVTDGVTPTPKANNKDGSFKAAAKKVRAITSLQRRSRKGNHNSRSCPASACPSNEKADNKDNISRRSTKKLLSKADRTSSMASLQGLESTNTTTHLERASSRACDKDTPTVADDTICPSEVRNIPVINTEHEDPLLPTEQADPDDAHDTRDESQDTGNLLNADGNNGRPKLGVTAERSISIGEDERLIEGPNPTMNFNLLVPGGSPNPSVSSRSASPNPSIRSLGSYRSEGRLSNSFFASFDMEDPPTSGDGNKEETHAETVHSPALTSKAVKSSIPIPDKKIDRPKSPREKMKKIQKGVTCAVKIITTKLNTKHHQKSSREPSTSETDGDDPTDHAVDKDKSLEEGVNAFRRNDRLRQPVVKRSPSSSPVRGRRDLDQSGDTKKGSSPPFLKHEDRSRPTRSVQSPTPSKIVRSPSLDVPDGSTVVPNATPRKVQIPCRSVNNKKAVAQGTHNKSAADDNGKVKLSVPITPQPESAMHIPSLDTIDGPTSADGSNGERGHNYTTNEHRIFDYGARQKGSYERICEDSGEGKRSSACTIYNPNDRETLKDLIEIVGLTKSFHEYTKSRYRNWEKQLKDILRGVCGIEYFRDDGYLYDNDDGMVADIVDWHDPGPYASYFPQEMLLQTSDRFKTVEFEDNKKRTAKVVHQKYGGWFEPQIMVILKSKEELHRNIGWSLSNKSPVTDEEDKGDVTEKVQRFMAPVDREDWHLDLTATRRPKRFPLWYYMYMKTGITIADGVTPLTFSNVYRAFDFYTKPNPLEIEELGYDVESVEKISTVLTPEIPVSSTPSITLLEEIEHADAVGTFQKAYINMLADVDVIFSGDDILRVPAFVKSRKTLFGAIITFVCLNILVTLLSLVTIFVMLTKSMTYASRYRVTSYFVLWDIVGFFRRGRR